MTSENEVLMLTRGGEGHHNAHIAMFETLFSMQGIASSVTEDLAAARRHPGPVFVLMVEQYPIAAYLLSWARALRGRRTVGLLFRSQEILEARSLRHRIKAAMLRLTRLVPRTAILTIVPHALLPNIGAYSRDWIDDPQLWDLPYLPVCDQPTPLSERVVAEARGRPVILVAGVLSKIKGLEMILDLAGDDAFASRYCLAIAGKLVGDDGAAAKLQGFDCVLENRYISDDELLSLYRVSRFVWTAYHPDYDQASGVFGRAVQFGLVPIVREGSVIDRYRRDLGIAAAVIQWKAPPAACIEALASADISSGSAGIMGARGERSASLLLELLGQAG